MAIKKTECIFCGYKTVCTEVEHQRASKIEGSEWFCDICRNTFGVNAYYFPTQYDNHYLLRSMNYLANRILSALKEAK